jgi:7-cyano-7-deazaguanine synthase
MSSKVLVVLSGGLDSTTLAYDLEVKGWRVSAVSFDYGQTHGQQEIACAQRHAMARQWSHEVVDLSKLGTLLQSSLTGHADVPEGHYADENMKATIVPNRNAIMLSIATGIAVSHGIPYVATAVHAGDHPIYPDCRGDFITALSEAFRLGNAPKFTGIMAPFINRDKNWIAQRAVDLTININGTYSCYKGGSKHCGRCGTCVERMEAIWSTSLYTDLDTGDITEQRLEALFPPSKYEDNTFWMTALEGAK